MKRTRCPYCGKRLNYFQAFAERKQGEYKCKRCGRSSTVYFSRTYKFLVGVVVLLAIVMVIIFTTPVFIKNLWGMLWTAVPFLILYLVTPFFLRLVPIKKRKTIDYERIEESSHKHGGIGSDDDIISNADTKTVPNLGVSSETSDDFLDISELNL